MSAQISKARRRHGPDRDPTERIVGLSAARAVLRVRPEAVLHIAYSPGARGALADLLREAARLRIAYREVPETELSRIASTVHHEGVCLQVKARPPFGVSELVRRLRAGGFVLALDQVQNPHNVGALLRSAAYFGAAAMLLSSREARSLSPAAARIAEGGAEYVPVCVVSDLPLALDRLIEAGAEVIGADAHEGEALHEARFSERVVLVLGSERTGLSQAVQERCARRVHIPGTGPIESLNVSVAAGILLAHAAAPRAETR